MRPLEERAATSADVQLLIQEIAAVRQELAALRLEVGQLNARLDQPNGTLVPGILPPDPADQLVTLDQMAAIVHRRKRSLENYRGRGLPEPKARGHRGQAARWSWATARPWLEDAFGLTLPESYPGMG